MSNNPPLSTTSLYEVRDSADNHSCGLIVDARGGSLSSIARRVSLTILGLDICITNNPDSPVRLVHDKRGLVLVPVEIRRRARAHIIAKWVRRVRVDQERLDALDEGHQV